MREDKDLEFLNKCDDKDLETLVHILVYDKDGKKRKSECLSTSESYKQSFPKHGRYCDEIISEIQCYGGNTIANTFRGGKGVTYREILEDVCAKYKVKYESTLSTIAVEDLLLMSIFESSLDNMGDKERKELLENFNKKTTDLSTSAIMSILQVSIRSSGFASYRLSAVVVNAVLKTLTGKGLSFVANQTVMRGISIMSGPIGWSITAGWTAIELAGPAYRVTVPAVMEIIYLRRKSNRPFYKIKRWILHILYFWKN